MDNTLRMALLFDFYGPLLTRRQQDVFDMYFHEDLSLGEVGEELEVSRQAVHDILKRTGTILEELESKLGLVEKHTRRQELYQELLELVELCRRDSENCQNHLAAMEEKLLKAQQTS